MFGPLTNLDSDYSSDINKANYPHGIYSSQINLQFKFENHVTTAYISTRTSVNFLKYTEGAYMNQSTKSAANKGLTADHGIH